MTRNVSPSSEMTARRDDVATGCPSDLDLACFVDGLLDESGHAAFLRHLDGCDDCRDVVATVVEALHDDGEPAPAPSAAVTRARSGEPHRGR